MRDKFKNINTVIIDVDGTLTDGRIVIAEDGKETKFFYVKDGLGIKLLQKFGIDVVICSGRTSTAAEYRCRELNIDQVFQGISEKGIWITNFMKEHNLKKENIAYIGDDLSDIPAMIKSAWSVAVSDASERVKQISDYTTVRKGGMGAVREAIDFLLKKKKLLIDIIEE